VRLSGYEETPVEGFQLGVPVKDSRQCGSVEALPQSLTPTFDVSRASSQTAVVVIGSKAGDSGSLFTGDAADLRHAHQDGDGRSQANAVHASDQIEPIGEIAILANDGDQLLKLSIQQHLEPVDLLLPELPNTLLAAGLTAGLELANILGELLDHRQVLGQRRQTSIRRFMNVYCGRRAAGDQDGIDVVVLGIAARTWR
jgi:hypothetical protein